VIKKEIKQENENHSKEIKEDKGGKDKKDKNSDEKDEDKRKVSFLRIKFERKIEENSKENQDLGKSTGKRRRVRRLERNVDPKYQKSIKDFLERKEKVEEDRPIGARRKMEDKVELNYIGSPRTPKTRKLGRN